MNTDTPVPLPDDVTALEASFQEDLFPPLTGNDRCDADAVERAVAQVLVNGTDADGKPTTTVLRLCGHHWRINSERLSAFPHDVPEEDSRPFTERRSQELGGAQNRSQGDAHA